MKRKEDKNLMLLDACSHLKKDVLVEFINLLNQTGHYSIVECNAILIVCKRGQLFSLKTDINIILTVCIFLFLEALIQIFIWETTMPGRFDPTEKPKGTIIRQSRFYVHPANDI